ncbi:MAG: glycosyltransferase family 39 protein [Acidimicrobiia bacterium]
MVDYAVPLLLVTVAAVARIGDAALWRDEIASVQFATRPLGDLVHLLLGTEANMGPYYLVLHFWMRLGESDVWIRALSVLGGLTSVVLTVALGQRWFGRAVGVVAGVLLAVHPMFLDYLTEARAYSWAMAAALAATLAIRMDDGTVRTVRYGVATGVGIALNLVNGLFLVAHACAFVTTRARRSMWASFARGIVLGGIIVLPVIPPLWSNRHSQVTWISHLSPVGFFAAAKDLAGGRVLAVMIGGVLLWTFYRCWRLDLIRSQPPVALLMASICVPIVGLALVSTVQPLFVDRYMIGVVPFLVLGVSFGLVRPIAAAFDQDRTRLLNRRALLVAGAGVLVFLAAGWSPLHDRPRDDDPRAIAHHLSDHASGGDVVDFERSWDRTGVLRYLDRRDIELVAGGDASGDVDWRVGSAAFAGAGGTCFGDVCIGRAVNPRPLLNQTGGGPH